jgi:hypothetical protein
MKRSYNPQAQRQGVMQSKSVPAPIGGWNTRDAYSGMPTQDAIILDNLIPNPKGVDSRNGYTSYATGLPTDVETLAEYNYEGVRKFIAASGSKIFDVSTSGVAIELSSGFTSARWQTAQFSGRLFFANGSDIPQYYDGTSIIPTAFTGTDLTPENIIGITVFKNRLFLWERDSQDFWYAGLNNVQGALTKFPLSRVSKLGGKIVSVVTLSRDSGDGSDDYIAFVMSKEVIAYRGSDPGDASNWSMVGRYPIGETISTRAIIEYGSDVRIVTKSDIISLRDVATLSPDQIVKSKLSGAFSDAAKLYSQNYGWEGIFYPESNWLLFNVPLVTNDTYYQFGINTITGGAFRFKGWNARTFGVYNNRLYFGGDGVIYLADEGQSDNGAAINIEGQKAFDALDSFKRKKMEQIRPLIKVDGNFTVNIGLAFDYGDVLITQTSSSISVGSPWDVSPWDVTPWSPENLTRTDTYGASGVGETISIKLTSSLNGQSLRWFQTDLGFKILSNFS